VGTPGGDSQEQSMKLLPLPMFGRIFIALLVMTISALTTSSANSFNLVGGSDTLKVGGSLAVGAAQRAANYTGSVSVTVTYN
jgi:hypothetical protein